MFASSSLSLVVSLPSVSGSREMSNPIMKPFALASKPRSTHRESTSTKRPADEAFTTGDDTKDNREYVTEFDSSKLPSKNRKDLVIPPIPNEWRPEKRMKSLYLPAQSDDENLGLQFVLESVPTDPAADDSTGYGLNVRGTENGHTDQKAVAAKAEDLVLHKLREDLDRLPDAKGFDEFEDVPVEGFGHALLSGYGWKEGRGIGRGWDKKEDVKVVEIHRRTAKEGLGFTGEIPKPPPTDVKGKQITAKVDNNGGGGGSGRRANEVKKESWSQNNSEVTKRKRDITKTSSEKINESWSQSEEVTKMKRDTKDHRVKEESQVLWLRSNIRVRIVSKKIKGGRFYLKKGVVLDVVGPTTCDISMDDSKELIQGVDQELLETAIPRPGGGVIVLFGKHKGVYGSLVKRDTENETGVVRDGDTHELINVRLEQIAEYVGDPSDIGY